MRGRLAILVVVTACLELHATPQFVVARRAPILSALSPSSGAEGDTVVIAGLAFGPSPQDAGTVIRFNGTAAATASSWSDTSVTVTVPTGATTGSVTMTRGGLTSNALTFTVTAAASATCSVTLTAGQMATPTALQSALLAATSGQTICLPSGTFTWTSGIDIFDSVTPGFHTIAANVTVQGNTTCTGGTAATLSCTDNTIIVDNINRGGGDRVLLGIQGSVPTSGTFRLTGVTFRMPNPCTPYCSDNGPVRLSPPSTTPATVRMDNVHFDHVSLIGWVFSNIQGVNDHSVYDMNSGSADNSTRPLGLNPGNTEWNTAVTYGQQANWFYVEFNKFTNGIINDCLSAGRQVYRYNATTNAAYQQHGTGHAGENRGCRAAEIYRNTFVSGAGASTAFATVYNGGMLFWGNAGGTGFTSALQMNVTRRATTPYPQVATPNGWGYCGTSVTGTGSSWDQNTSAVTGYLCLDQPGRGYGDLISGSFPSKLNSATGTIAWPHQSIEPVYEWSNTGTASGGTWVVDFHSSLVANKDYYVEHGNTNCNPSAGSCTAGVGTGTRAQRPVNCVANAGTAGLDTKIPGVAWWATDQGGNWDVTNGTANDGTLDVCTATNTWTNAYYTPLAFPHALEAAKTVTTAFPLTENPISESSTWHHLDSTLTNVKTEVLSGVHVAHGTQDGTGGFDDSNAYLSGYALNQAISGTVWKNPAIPATPNFEVELLLRWSDDNAPHATAYGPTSAEGYEINVSHLGNYLNIGKFKGALLATTALGSVPVTGDVFLANVITSGTSAIITVYWNGVQKLTYTDTSPYTKGNPGIGFYIDAGATNDKFGFSSVSAWDLP